MHGSAKCEGLGRGEGGTARAHSPGGTTAAAGCRAALALMGLLLLAGCAPMQVVPLQLGPAPLSVYVDGRALPDDAPSEVELRADRAHVLFVKKPGHHPERVVLESRREGGVARLSPDRIELRLTPIQPTGRSVDVQLDD